MNVLEFIAALQRFSQEAPHNGHAHVMVQIADDNAFEFGAANHAWADGGQNFLVLTANERGTRLRIRDVKIH